MTKVSIDSPDMGLTDAMKEAVNKTSEKTEKYMDGMSLDCVIRKESKKSIHVLLKYKPLHGPDILAEASNSDFYAGLTQAQKKLVRQVVDLKNKREDDKKHQHLSINSLATETPQVDQDQEEQPSEAA